jgi:hypothetical protein
MVISGAGFGGTDVPIFTSYLATIFLANEISPINQPEQTSSSQRRFFDV